MKHRFLVGSLVAMIGLSVPAAASATCGPLAHGDFRSTWGLSSGFWLHVAFSARDADGYPVGSVRETLGSADGVVSQLRGKVTCLTVSGNVAAIGFVVTRSAGGSLLPVGASQVLLVRDDRAGDRYAFAGTDDCDAAVGLEPGGPISGGDIVVRP